MPISLTGTIRLLVSAGPEWQPAHPARANTARPASAPAFGASGGRRRFWNADMALLAKFAGSPGTEANSPLSVM